MDDAALSILCVWGASAQDLAYVMWRRMDLSENGIELLWKDRVCGAVYGIKCGSNLNIGVTDTQGVLLVPMFRFLTIAEWDAC